MHHVPRPRLTLPAVAGRLQRGVRPHSLPDEVWDKYESSHCTGSSCDCAEGGLLKRAPAHELQIVAMCRHGESDKAKHQVEEPSFFFRLNYNVVAVVIDRMHKLHGYTPFVGRELHGILLATDELGPGLCESGQVGW